MTQKQFVISLIESEVNRDLAHRAAEAEQRVKATASAFDGSSVRAEGGSVKKQSKSGFGDEIEKSNDEGLEDQESADIIEN